MLVDQYKTPGIFDGNFWFGGNALHAYLDYLFRAGETDTNQILPTANKIYQSMSNNPGWWRDDYGWWGIAFVVAINNRVGFGYKDPSYDPLFKDLRDATQYCWKQLNDNWDNSPYGRGVDIVGGVWNTKDTTQPLAGRNSVTNEGFWILSMALAQLSRDKIVPENPQYEKMAKAEQSWFEQWLSLPAKQPGMTGILNKQGLVLERPMGNTTDPAFYWSGDQGLCIRAFRSLPGALPNDIARSVIKNMIDRNGILHEYLGFVDRGLEGFIADYATGKGVFMRNLANINQPMGSYSDFIKKNATAVWCNQLGGNQFGFNWNPRAGGEPKILLAVGTKNQALCNLIMQAAGQDALNAAVSIAPDEVIPGS